MYKYLVGFKSGKEITITASSDFKMPRLIADGFSVPGTIRFVSDDVFLNVSEITYMVLLSSHPQEK